MNGWEKYSNLNMENVTGSHYSHAKRIWKHFEIEKLSEYNDLYLKSETLLLYNVFLKTSKMCLEISEFDSTKFLSGTRLVWKAALKMIKVKLELLTDIDMLLM